MCVVHTLTCNVTVVLVLPYHVVLCTMLLCIFSQQHYTSFLRTNYIIIRIIRTQTCTHVCFHRLSAVKPFFSFIIKLIPIGRELTMRIFLLCDQRKAMES